MNKQLKALNHIDKVQLLVVVFNYNRANFLAKCLDSILLQKTDIKFRIVVLDDCSCDESRDVVQKIKVQFPSQEVHFFSPNRNLGGGQHVMEFFKEQLDELSDTDYIYKIDSDDFLINDFKFSRQIDFLQKHPNCVAHCHRYKIYNEIDNVEIVTDDLINGEFSSSELIRLLNKVPTYTHISTYMFRNVHKSLSCPESRYKFFWGDTLLVWAMLKHGNVFYDKECMSVYRVHAGGVWTSFKSKDSIFFKIGRHLKIIWILRTSDKFLYSSQVIKKYLKIF